MTNAQGNRKGITICVEPWIKEALTATVKMKDAKMPVSVFVKGLIMMALDPNIRRQFEPQNGEKGGQ